MQARFLTGNFRVVSYSPQPPCRSGVASPLSVLRAAPTYVNAAAEALTRARAAEYAARSAFASTLRA